MEQSPIKWGSNSCWIDSLLMLILAFPTAKMYNILNSELNENDIDLGRLTCEFDSNKVGSPSLVKVHQAIQDLYEKIQTPNKDNCNVKNIWKLMTDCNLIAYKIGDYASIHAMFDGLAKLYPSAFITPTIQIHDPEKSIKDKLSSEIQNGILSNNKSLNEKLLGILVDDKYHEIRNLDDEFVVETMLFTLRGIVSFERKGHIQSIFKNNMTNTWMEYDGFARTGKYNDIGDFSQAKKVMINEVLKKRSVVRTDIFDSLLVYEVKEIEDVIPVAAIAFEPAQAAQAQAQPQSLEPINKKLKLNDEGINDGYNGDDDVNNGEEDGSDRSDGSDGMEIDEPPRPVVPILQPQSLGWWDWAKRKIGMGRLKRRMSFQSKYDYPNRNLFFKQVGVKQVGSAKLSVKLANTLNQAQHLYVTAIVFQDKDTIIVSNAIRSNPPDHLKKPTIDIWERNNNADEGNWNKTQILDTPYEINWIFSLAIQNDSLVSGAYNAYLKDYTKTKSVFVWEKNTNNGKWEFQQPLSNKMISAVAIDNNTIVSSSSKALEIWTKNINKHTTRKPSQSLWRLQQEIDRDYTATAIKDDMIVATVGNNVHIYEKIIENNKYKWTKVYDVEFQEELENTDDSYIYKIIIQNDTTFITFSYFGTIKIWEKRDDKLWILQQALINPIQQQNMRITGQKMVLSPDHNIIVCGLNEFLVIYHKNNQSGLWELLQIMGPENGGHTSTITGLAILDDTIMTGSLDSTIKEWRILNKEDQAIKAALSFATVEPRMPFDVSNLILKHADFGKLQRRNRQQFFPNTEPFEFIPENDNVVTNKRLRDQDDRDDRDDQDYRDDQDDQDDQDYRDDNGVDDFQPQFKRN